MKKNYLVSNWAGIRTLQPFLGNVKVFYALRIYRCTCILIAYTKTGDFILLSNSHSLNNPEFFDTKLDPRQTVPDPLG